MAKDYCYDSKIQEVGASYLYTLVDQTLTYLAELLNGLLQHACYSGASLIQLNETEKCSEKGKTGRCFSKSNKK